MLANNSTHGGIDNNQIFTYILANQLRSRIFYFKAQRMISSDAQFSTSIDLSPDASNLAQVINNLQTKNPALFTRFIKYINVIFPQIKYVTAPPISGNQARVYLWSVVNDTERDDLAVPLSESGTGVGQVLAILYVVLTANFPKIILIDEPQSFLHPNAIRKLFEILKNYPHHQYIVSTHSPAIITSTEPKTVLQILKKEDESKIQKVNIYEIKELQNVLNEIGARFSDVFGEDNILWVEGPTEERCFPLILSKIKNKPLFGTAIISVVKTGDFEVNGPRDHKRSKRILEIYQRLSSGRAISPPSVGFIFDREIRKDANIKDLERQGKGTVFFLKRRMYENYLLNPDAVAFIFNEFKENEEPLISPEQVKEWIENHKWEKRYFETKIDEADKTNEKWNLLGHGAHLLEDLIKEFLEPGYSYNKIKYGEALTTWILGNSPEDLQEISDLITEVLETAKTRII